MINKPLHIVILAAGKGSRMRSSLPKVLHEVAGKSLLAHVVDTALTLNPAQIHVVVGHGKEQVIEAFESHPKKELLTWVEQALQLGTGHAVAQAIPKIGDNSSVLMLTADVPLIKANTLSAMVDAMQTAQLALLTAVVDNPFGLGRILRDDTDSVTGIIEEKTDVVGLAHASGAAIATMQPEDNKEINGINSRSQLALVERLYQLECAEKLMASGVTIIDPARFDVRGDVTIGEDCIIDVNVVIEGPTTIGRNVKIGPNCLIQGSKIGDDATVYANSVIESAVLGEDVLIGPFARLRPGSNLANNVKIGNFVETKNAQLSEGVKVNHLSYVGDASVGDNTNIGAGVITCNYDGANKHQTTIGRNVFVGSDCQLVAPVTIADQATIGAGSTITSNVAEGELAISRSQQRKIAGWQRPIKKSK